MSIRRDYYLSTLSIGFNIFVTFLSYPIFLRFYGTDSYGMWITISLVISLGELGNLGISQAAIKFISKTSALGNFSASQIYYTTGLAFVLSVGLVYWVISTLFDNWIAIILGLEITNKNLFYINIAAFLSMVSFIISYQSGVFTAYSKNYIVSFILLFRNLFKLLATVGFYYFLNSTLDSILYGTFLSTIVTFILCNLLLRKYTDLKVFSLVSFDREKIREMLSYGISIFGSKISNMALIPLLKITISNFSSFSSVTYFEIVYNSAFSIRSLFERGLVILIPEAAKLVPTRNNMRALYERGLKLFLSYSIVFYILLFLSAEYLLNYWIGPEFGRDLYWNFLIMNFSMLVSLFGVPAYYILMGGGKEKEVFYESLIKIIVVYIFISLFYYFNDFDLISLSEVILSLGIAYVISHIYLLFRVLFFGK